MASAYSLWRCCCQHVQNDDVHGPCSCMRWRQSASTYRHRGSFCRWTDPQEEKQGAPSNRAPALDGLFSHPCLGRPADVFIKSGESGSTEAWDFPDTPCTRHRRSPRINCDHLRSLAEYENHKKALHDAQTEAAGARAPRPWLTASPYALQLCMVATLPQSVSLSLAQRMSSSLQRDSARPNLRRMQITTTPRAPTGPQQQILPRDFPGRRPHLLFSCVFSRSLVRLRGVSACACAPPPQRSSYRFSSSFPRRSFYMTLWASPTCNLRRYVGIALAFVVDAAQPGSCRRGSQTFARRQQERNQAVTILTYREVSRISHLPSPCAALH